LVFAVQEHQELFPGVIAERLPVRDYPNGQTGAHVLGYLNQISETELAEERFADYRGGDLVGRAGLEAAYEEHLRGTAGNRLLEVNAQNRVLDVLRETDPQPGNDLIVSLDPEVQAAVERMLEEGMIASRDFVRDDGRNLPSSAGAAVVWMRPMARWWRWPRTRRTTRLSSSAGCRTSTRPTSTRTRMSRSPPSTARSRAATRRARSTRP
jgi:penicillin-binding protein 2